MIRIRWRRSSYCTASECVEAASWRKSTHSGYNGNCVEAGHGPCVVGVRDSQLGDRSPVLEFSAGTWAAFVAALKT